MDFLGALPLLSGDDDEDEILGARRRRRSRYRGGGRASYPRTGAAASRYAAGRRANLAAGWVRPDLPGAPARDCAQLPAGFPLFTFVLATGTNIITQIANPQTAFRGQRLSCIVIRSGASALLTAPLMRSLQVGMKPIVVTPDGIALETFNQNAFDTNLLMPPTTPGTVYQLAVNLPTGVTGTDSIIAIVGIIGTAVL